jgi:hypothetical protein
MSYQRTLTGRALIVGLLLVSATTICNRAFGIGPGWPAGPVPTPLSTPPSGPSPSPAPSPTPSPSATPTATPIPPSYMQVISMESPRLQYRDGSYPLGTPSPFGPYTCVVAMYLNITDPIQFEVFRTFEPRFPNSVYGPSQAVSSPNVSAQYTAPGQLANILTTFTVYPHPENPYGRETLSIYVLDTHNTATLLGAVPILVYPKSTAKIFNALQPSVPPNPTPVASPSPYPNPSPYPLPSPPTTTNFTGDTARLNIEIDNAYPGGTTWITVTSPTTVQELVNSRITAPTTDLIAKRNVFIEVGTAKNASGGLLFPSSVTPTTYTVRVVQFRPPYYPPTFQEILATATFTVVSSSFNINSQLGRLTP